MGFRNYNCIETKQELIPIILNNEFNQKETMIDYVEVLSQLSHQNFKKKLKNFQGLPDKSNRLNIIKIE
jgi:hypothetical protein